MLEDQVHPQLLLIASSEAKKLSGQNFSSSGRVLETQENRIFMKVLKLTLTPRQTPSLGPTLLMQLSPDAVKGKSSIILDSECCFCFGSDGRHCHGLSGKVSVILPTLTRSLPGKVGPLPHSH